MAYKVGMTHEWDEHGAQVPLTILWIDDCQVCVSYITQRTQPCPAPVSKNTDPGDARWQAPRSPRSALDSTQLDFARS